MASKIILGLIVFYIFRKGIMKSLKLSSRLLEKIMPLLLIGLAVFYGRDFLFYWKSHPSLILITASVIVVYGMFKVINRFSGRPRIKSKISEVDQMSGEDFEIYLEKLFRLKGYQVQRTSYVGDYGVDLLIRDRTQKCAVQAKRYRGKVGVRAVQEVVAGMGYYDCELAMVVTNSQFTPQAVELAKKNGVILWDRAELVRQMGLVHKKKAKIS